MVELDDNTHLVDSTFVIIGSGTNNMNPQITCTCARFSLSCCPLPHGSRLSDASQGQRNAATFSATPARLHHRSTLQQTQDLDLR